MANPNIVNVTSIYGKTSLTPSLTSGTSDILVNQSGSGVVYKINTIIAANINGTSAADVNVWLAEGQQSVSYLASTISVPADSSLTVLDKGTAIYLTEGQSLKASASVQASISLVTSYEEIA